MWRHHWNEEVLMNPWQYCRMEDCGGAVVVVVVVVVVAIRISK
jgi:hypothetical protein